MCRAYIYIYIYIQVAGVPRIITNVLRANLREKDQGGSVWIWMDLDGSRWIWMDLRTEAHCAVLQWKLKLAHSWSRHSSSIQLDPLFVGLFMMVTNLCRQLTELLFLRRFLTNPYALRTVQDLGLENHRNSEKQEYNTISLVAVNSLCEDFPAPCSEHYCPGGGNYDDKGRGGSWAIFWGHQCHHA